MSLEKEGLQAIPALPSHTSQLAFLHPFQVEGVLGQCLLTGPVLLLPTLHGGSVEALAGQLCTLRELTLEAGCPAAAAAQARLLEGFLEREF